MRRIWVFSPFRLMHQCLLAVVSQHITVLDHTLVPHGVAMDISASAHQYHPEYPHAAVYLSRGSCAALIPAVLCTLLLLAHDTRRQCNALSVANLVIITRPCHLHGGIRHHKHTSGISVCQCTQPDSPWDSQADMHTIVAALGIGIRALGLDALHTLLQQLTQHKTLAALGIWIIRAPARGLGAFLGFPC